jgi:DeoR/GlpR family transcriptional regulator of sugar metabolism
MRGDERRELIVAEVLANNGHVSELAERFKTSPATIRRDLERLKDEGRVTRTYGGAVARPRAIELSLQEKELSYPREKEAIGRLAAGLVEDGDVVILDAGTTPGHIALELRERQGITVVTNGMSALAALRDADGIEVIVLGGTLRHHSQAVIGSLAEDTVRRIRADKVFLGADGVVVGEGLNSPTEAQAHWKSVILGQAEQVFVVVDHSKLGVRRFAYITPVDRDYTLITDWAASPSQLQSFVEQGIPVLRADAPT